MLRIPIADVLASVGLAVAVALLVTRTAPNLSGEQFTLAIGKFPSTSVSKIPHSTIPARIMANETQNRVKHRVTVFTASGGVFTVSGAAHFSPGAMRRMQLWLNGEPVTYSMLDGDWSARDSLERIYPIAHNVRLRPGNNDLEIRTSNTDAGLLVKFARQRESQWGLAVPVGVGVLALTWLVSVAVNRLFHDFWRPAATIAATLALTGGALGWIAFVRGADLIRSGETAPEIEASLRQFRKELAAMPAARATGPTRVVTIGDSTHLLAIARDPEHPQFEFKNALAKSLERGSPGNYTVVGTANGGMTARDFYLIANEAVTHRPDVLIVPINIATFEDRWYENPMWHFDSLERFLQLRELPRATFLPIGSRRFHWDRVLLQKLDAACLDRRGGRFVVGLRAQFANELTRANLLFNCWRMGVSPAEYKGWQGDPASEFAALFLRQRSSRDQPRKITIDADNPIIQAFRAINAMTRRYGIHVIYYSSPLDDVAQLEKGVDFRPNVNFRTIRDGIASSPNVTFLTLHDSMPRDLFKDRFVHMTANGLQFLADKVATEIIESSRKQSTRP